jgi:hypothetical protein
MCFRKTALFLFLFSIQMLSAQYAVGIGASLHRYDQVLSVKGVKTLNAGGLGLELGCGVERSLQGALAPQAALFWQAPLPLKDRHYALHRPYYMLRYQFDFQKAGFLDTYHGIYGGLGYAFGFGVRHSLLLQLGLGAVVEYLYIPNLSNPQRHFFLNPQVQLNYYFRIHAN